MARSCLWKCFVLLIMTAAAIGFAGRSFAQGAADPGIVADVLRRLDEAAVKIEELTQRVDKLEKSQSAMRKEVASLKERARPPRCSSNGTISLNATTGETEDCKPYLCNTGTGLCEAACGSAERCARGFECRDHQCVKP